jgi:hypothetical protein
MYSYCGIEYANGLCLYILIAYTIVVCIHSVISLAKSHGNHNLLPLCPTSPLPSALNRSQYVGKPGIELAYTLLNQGKLGILSSQSI